MQCSHLHSCRFNSIEMASALAMTARAQPASRVQHFLSSRYDLWGALLHACNAS